jgi:hypothetical protein
MPWRQWNITWGRFETKKRLMSTIQQGKSRLLGRKGTNGSIRQRHKSIEHQRREERMATWRAHNNDNATKSASLRLITSLPPLSALSHTHTYTSLLHIILSLASLLFLCYVVSCCENNEKLTSTFSFSNTSDPCSLTRCHFIARERNWYVEFVQKI